MVESNTCPFYTLNKKINKSTLLNEIFEKNTHNHFVVLVLVVKVLNAGFECAEYFRVFCHISCKNTSKTRAKEGFNNQDLISNAFL